MARGARGEQQVTAEEHARWKDFSTRLAHHGWPKATEQRKKRIAEVVGWFIDQYGDAREDVHGWDSDLTVSISRDLSEFLDSHCHRPIDVMTETRFERQVSSCVRAGIDVAVSPSGGVVGFNVGTLRRMYDGEIPGWIAQWFEPPLSGNEADTAGVWL